MQTIQKDVRLINGRYQLIKELGRGGMGVVHLATDRLTGETVALKQVLIPMIRLMFASVPNLNSNSELRLALAHEFQTLASLRHPHIISVLDYGFDEKQLPYFAMTYLDEAQTLVEAANQVDARQKIQFILELLQALAYLHRRGILHRDIKPENVLVSDNTVRVLDFGLAIAKEEARESVGSWLYMAPEVLLEQPATEAADLYAVGVLAFYLFANRHPFDIYAPDILEDILETPPDISLLGEIGEGVTAVIAKLLAKKPEDRYHSAEAAIAAFDEALGKPAPGETQAIRESYLQAATFVGRDAEMKTLLTAMQRAKDGQGAAWLISGESGVGKSRLLDELRIRALVDGALVLRGQTIENAGQSYQLWREAVRRLALATELDDLAIGVLKAIVPDIDTLLARTAPAVPELSGQAGRQRLISTITHLFQPQKQWILLILEDLQWARESLDVLRQLSRLTGGLPLLVVGSYRDDEVDLQLTLPQMQHLHLERFSSDDISQLSTAMLGEAGKQAEVLALLQRETEGNAFFLVEVVRALAIEAGRLSAVGRMALPDKLFPEGIQTIVKRRLSRLPEDARPLLPSIAVMGRRVDLSLVQATIDRLGYDVRLEAWLSYCSEAMVLEIENGRWQFAHDKLREGILNHLTPNERVGWHRQAAEVIETVYPDTPEQAASLVYHWRAVGENGKERYYAQVAGDYARKQFLNAEALTYLSRALELTSPDDLSQQYELLHAREQIYHLQGAREAQQQELDALQALAEKMVQKDGTNHLGEVALRLANYAEATANYEIANAAASQALQIGQGKSDVSLIAASHLALGRALMRMGNYAESRKHLDQSLATAQSNKLFQIEADSYRFLGVAAIELSQYEQAQTFLHKAQALYRQIEDQQGESTVLNNLAIVSHALGDLGQSLTFWERAQQIFDAIGDREGRGRILTNLSSLSIGLADYETAQRYGEEALQICREINVRIGEIFNLNNLGLVAHFTDKAADADRYSQQALDVAREINNSLLSGYNLKDRGFILTYQNRLEEAEALYQEALSLWTELDQVSQILETKAGLGHNSLLRGDLAAANAYIAPIVDHLRAGRTLDGTGRPFYIYLICYQILVAQQNSVAAEILTSAYKLLQERASRISDEARRQSYLENVPARRLVAKAFEKEQRQ